MSCISLSLSLQSLYSFLIIYPTPFLLQSCILEAIDKSHAPAFFGCPTCQKRQEISDVNNGAMRLTNDYTILKEIKRRQLDLYEASCDECNDEVAAGYRCRDCGGTALCNFHMEAHERSRALKSHTVSNMYLQWTVDQSV